MEKKNTKLTEKEDQTGAEPAAESTAAEAAAEPAAAAAAAAPENPDVAEEKVAETTE